MSTQPRKMILRFTSSARKVMEEFAEKMKGNPIWEQGKIVMKKKKNRRKMKCNTHGKII